LAFAATSRSDWSAAVIGNSAVQLKRGWAFAKPARAAAGFTLIELLVVVAIIALLISILLPTLHSARAQARSAKCLSHARQLATGWLTYATEYNGILPGGTWDFYNRRTRRRPQHEPSHPVNYQRFFSMCWLGTIYESGEQTGEVPSQGTIFPYLSRQEEVYKCPEDELDVAEDSQFGPIANDTKYSYTAAPMLTGAPLSLFRVTRWADRFDAAHNWQDWDRQTTQSEPWLFVEEDEAEALAYVTDSAWSNVDGISDRHQGRGLVAHMDGHAVLREFQRRPARFTAWHVYYELYDGRMITGGYWYDTRDDPRLYPILFGYLRGRYVNGVLEP